MERVVECKHSVVVPWSMLLVISLLVGCGSTEKDWERARTEGTVEAVQSFLTKHGDSELAPKARSVLEDLVYSEAKSSGDQVPLAEYLAAYPQGKHASEAATLLEELSFQALGDAPDISALQGFLRQYPEGAFAARVEARLGELMADLWNAATATGTKGGYREFLALNPGEPWTGRAETKLRIIEIAAENGVEKLKAHPATMGGYVPGRLVSCVFDSEVDMPGMAAREWAQMGGETPPAGPGELNQGDRVLVHAGLSQSTGKWIVVYIEKIVK